MGASLWSQEWYDDHRMAKATNAPAKEPPPRDRKTSDLLTAVFEKEREARQRAEIERMMYQTGIIRAEDIPWDTGPCDPPPKPKTPIEKAMDRMDKIGDDD